MDWNKRKEEIINTWNNTPKSKPIDIIVFIDKIISQEKEMIKEFANECLKGYAGIAAITARNHINKLLSDRNCGEL